MRTVRRIAPAVILEGRLAAVGTSKARCATSRFNGTAQHQDGSPAEQLEGRCTSTPGSHPRPRHRCRAGPSLLRRDPSRLSHAEARGELRGRSRVRAHWRGWRSIPADPARSDRWKRTASPHSATPVGRGRSAAPVLAARSGALTGRELHQRSNGELRVTGIIDTAAAPEGEMRVGAVPQPDPGVDPRQRLRPWPEPQDSLIPVDTAYAEWKGAAAAGRARSAGPGRTRGGWRSTWWRTA